jgi:hypothetical protein
MSRYTTEELYRLYDSTTTMTSAEINYYIDSVTAAINQYIDRDLERKYRIETVQGYDDNILFSRQWPINRVHAITYPSFEVARIKLSNTNMSQFSIDTYQEPLTEDTDENFEPVTFIRVTVDFDEGSILEPDINTAINAIPSTITGLGGTATTEITIDEKYKDSKTWLINDVRVTQQFGHLEDGEEYTVYFYGCDKQSLPQYNIENERMIVTSSKIGLGTSKITMYYDAGYTLPEGTDYGTLPRNIIDVANAAVKLLSESTDNPVPVGVLEEKLGNAQYKYDGNSLNNSTAMGIINQFSDVLNYYKRKDIIYI